MDLKENALAGIEIALEKAIEAKSDEVVEQIILKIEEKTPGWLDALIEGKKEEIKVAIKAELLKLAEKISDKV